MPTKVRGSLVVSKGRFKRGYGVWLLLPMAPVCGAWTRPLFSRAIMAVTVEMHNTGDPGVRSGVVAVIEHSLGDWPGDWRVSMIVVHRRMTDSSSISRRTHHLFDRNPSQEFEVSENLTCAEHYAAQRVVGNAHRQPSFFPDSLVQRHRLPRARCRGR